jgi:hypothetical protein
LNWTYLWYDASGPMAPDEFAHRATELFLHGFEALRIAGDEGIQSHDHPAPQIGCARGRGDRPAIVEKRDDLEDLVARTAP